MKQLINKVYLLWNNLYEKGGKVPKYHKHNFRLRSDRGRYVENIMSPLYFQAGIVKITKSIWKIIQICRKYWENGSEIKNLQRVFKHWLSYYSIMYCLFFNIFIILEYIKYFAIIHFIISFYKRTKFRSSHWSCPVRVSFLIKLRGSDLIIN